MLQEKDLQTIKEMFSRLKKDVTIINFTQELECQYCKETYQLINEIASVSDKIKVEQYNFQVDKEKVKEFDIKRIPATVIKGKDDEGIRFYGIPAGYEASAFIESIIMVSQGKADLSMDSQVLLKPVSTPVHIQVFTTPTCPHCPGAVITGNKLALGNKNIVCDMVEVSEFPELAHKYGVSGVPQIVINEEISFTGNLPEPAYIKHVLKAAALTGSKVPDSIAPKYAPGKTLHVSDDNFEKEVLKSDMPVLVDFWADWCMPCKILGPIIDEIAGEYKDKVKVCKVDTEEAMQIASQYRISSIPTVMIFNKGEMQDILVGVQPKNIYKDKLNKLIQ